MCPFAVVKIILVSKLHTLSNNQKLSERHSRLSSMLAKHSICQTFRQTLVEPAIVKVDGHECIANK